MVPHERQEVLPRHVLEHLVELGLSQRRPIHQNSGWTCPGRASNRCLLFRVHLGFVGFRSARIFHLCSAFDSQSKNDSFGSKIFARLKFFGKILSSRKCFFSSVKKNFSTLENNFNRFKSKFLSTHDFEAPKF